MTIALFSVAALFCFGIIWTFARDKSLDYKHYKLLCVTGMPAYFVGLSVIIWTGNVDNMLAGAVTILAWLCFVLLSGAFFMRTRNLSSREYTLMVLWGQATFPLVILALPEVQRLFN